MAFPAISKTFPGLIRSKIVCASIIEVDFARASSEFLASGTTPEIIGLLMQRKPIYSVKLNMQIQMKTMDRINEGPNRRRDSRTVQEKKTGG